MVESRKPPSLSAKKDNMPLKGHEALKRILRTNFEKNHFLLESVSRVATNHSPEVLALLTWHDFSEPSLESWYRRYEKFSSGYGGLKKINTPTLMLSADETSPNYWGTQLGKLDQEHWSEWFTFFSSEIASRGRIQAVQHFLNASTPLAASVAGTLLHGIISLGYGLALRNDDLTAEGLSLIAVRYSAHGPLAAPPAPAAGAPAIPTAQSLIDFVLTWLPSQPAEALNDIAKGTVRFATVNVGTLPQRAQAIYQAADAALALPDVTPTAVASLAVILQVVATVILIAACPRDFFALHYLTSAVALPAVTAALAPADAYHVLRRWWHLVVGSYIYRGCPAETRPSAMGTIAESAEGADGKTGFEAAAAVLTDLFIPTVEAHNDEHVVKGVLALLHTCVDVSARSARSASCEASVGLLGRVDTPFGIAGGHVCDRSDPALVAAALAGLQVSPSKIVAAARSIFAVPSPPALKGSDQAGDWIYPMVKHPYARSGAAASHAKSVLGNTVMRCPPALNFVLEHIGETAEDRAYRQKTELQSRMGMLGSPDEAHLLRWLLETTGAKRVIEVGVFRGTTTVQLAKGIGAGGVVEALDITTQWLEEGADEAWREAGVRDRIRFHDGPAVASMEKLVAEGGSGTYDMTFIDADKSNYGRYYELSLQLLRPGGFIVVDNVLWSGAVLNPPKDDPDTLTIAALNKTIRSDKRVSAVMVAIGDGVYLVRKL